MIFAAGYHASGKSHFAGILGEHFDTLHVETSAVVRGMWSKQGSEDDLQAWAAGMEAQHGNDFFDRVIASAIEERHDESRDLGQNVQDIIVTGNRSLTGISFLRQHFADTALGERPNTIVAMHADFQTLWQRFQSRGRRDGDATISQDAFLALTKSEQSRGIEDIFANADYHYTNNGCASEFQNWALQFAEVELSLDPSTAEVASLSSAEI